ncbi:hypothetical protein CA951_11235 [Rhodococcus sp. NCIMB 12038]|nr:hypothetical protein CA951_11235 [Rhodococcus sp. NCIMB 12038]
MAGDRATPRLRAASVQVISIQLEIGTTTPELPTSCVTDLETLLGRRPKSVRWALENNARLQEVAVF